MGNNYRDRLFECYVSSHFGNVRAVDSRSLMRDHPARRHLYGRFLPKSLEASILDLGCGFGAFLHFANHEGYKNVTGVDVSKEQIDIARKLGIQNAQCRDARRYLEEHPGEYDCVVALDFLEHLPKDDVLEVLDAVFQSLKPGGRIILQVPNGDGPCSGRYRYADFTHEFALTPDSACQLLLASGFVDVKVGGTEPGIVGLRSLVRVMMWKVVKLCYWVAVVSETGIGTGRVFTQNLIAVGDKARNVKTEE